MKPDFTMKSNINNIGNRHAKLKSNKIYVFVLMLLAGVAFGAGYIKGKAEAPPWPAPVLLVEPPQWVDTPTKELI